MTDDLGLGLRHEPTSPSDRPRYGRRRAVVVTMLLAVVAIAVAVAIGVAKFATGIFGAPADYSGRGVSSVVVQVHQGDSVTAIGQTLKSDGVVKSVGAFTDAASSDSRATSIGPGYYKLHKQMKASLALAMLLDPTSLVQSRIVVPEGFELKSILARIAADSTIKLADLQAAAASPASLGVPSWGAGHPLEGFLFPATYNFPPDTTAKQALTAMVTRFNQEMTAIHFVSEAHRRGYTPYQLLTLASIVQREGRLDSDFPKIAEVFFNRLHRGMALQSDATLFYVLPPNHGPLTSADLKLDSPYNTRTHAGLTPTPINSPGEQALKAVLSPATGPYLYFVTIDKAGHAAFATTLSEFNKLVAESRRNGVQ
jgi:UPF0755 protein